MKAGRLTSRGITQAYLDRIAALDRQGPALRAVLETNPDALTIADGLDAERRRGKVRGPLHGIPVIVKDNIDTHDKMQTTAGSLALEGNIAVRDAFIVERLRAAGAVILAKANLSEWANFRSSRSSSGWSGRGRQCRNPYVLDRTPSGSSSGSAVSVSANLCAVAVGTYGIDLNEHRIKAAIAKLNRLPPNASVNVENPNRLSILTRLSPGTDAYLYVGRVDPDIAGIVPGPQPNPWGDEIEVDVEEVSKE
jgi:hypothetical protein